MIKYSNICTKKTFTANGVDKVKWLNVGTLKEMEDGKKFIELNILPNETLFVFEQEKSETTTPPPATQSDNSGVSTENIPF